MCQLAYAYAWANEVTVPDSWKENKSAGIDWAELFMKRHANSLSLRTPEPTSLQRIACFNKENVKQFYDNLSSVVEKRVFHRIFYSIVMKQESQLPRSQESILLKREQKE